MPVIVFNQSDSDNRSAEDKRKDKDKVYRRKGMKRNESFPKWTVWLGVWMMMMMMVAGCSQDSSGSDSDTADRGELVVSLTDAEGDFASYTVDVLSIDLTRQNGTVVSTLPLTTRVDFAQYAEMTEFLTAATIPSGVYTEARLTLDYQNADIWVENADGDLVPINVIVDEDGNPVTTMTVSVTFPDSDALLIAPGIPAHLTLDFDLIASHQVEFGNDGTPTLTVAPILVAEIDPEDPKTHRLRGPLGDVDVDAGNFELIIRPFFHGLSGTDRPFGSLAVTVTEDTVYHINGLPYAGQAGLAAMNELTAYSAVVVTGDLKFNPYRFEAAEVNAGTSVPGGTLDGITGNVIRRDGDTIAVRGATLIRSDGSVIFCDTASVLLDQDTVVRRQLSTAAFSIGDISVGQRVTVLGRLTNSRLDSLELDATGENQGFVHMRLTRLRGTVVGINAGMTLDLQAIDSRRIGMFDFSGTGTDPDHDADPNQYEIATGTLDLSSVEPGEFVKLFGFMNGFGQAPADFLAQTIIDPSRVRSRMRVVWAPPSSTPFQLLTAEQMVLSPDGHGKFHHLGYAGGMIDLDDLSAPVTIQPLSDSAGRFLIRYRQSRQFYATFEAFVSSLDAYLADGRQVHDLFATGRFALGNAVFTAESIEVRIH